ncbi:MAG: hypothetical protein DKT66_14430 [Candidatus Melainabacteria bacterium]|nr:MAG: hypothetical protein DKT66_14430 [Candidatus Melainabacteria bacterium]
MNTSVLYSILQFMRYAIAIGCAWYAVNETMLGVASEKWPTVNAKVTSSIVKKVQTKHGTRDEAQIHYQYVVGGKTYDSDRIKFGGMQLQSHDLMVAAFPKGKQISIHYKPGDPGVSCLSTGVNQYSVGMLFAIAIAMMFIANSPDQKFGTSSSSFRSSSEPQSGLLRGIDSTSLGAQPKDKYISVKALLFLGALAATMVWLKNGLNGWQFGPIPGDLMAFIVLIAGCLGFIAFISFLPALAGTLARDRHFKWAEKVAKLNTKIASAMSSCSFETAVAHGLEAEIAQEQLQYPKALESSKRALSTLASRPNVKPELRGLDSKTQKAFIDAEIRYTHQNSEVESLCNESIGCIYFDMGMYDKAREHAEKALRLAQDNYNTEGISQRPRLALAAALALSGKIETVQGCYDDARLHLEKAVKVRKEMPKQFEEQLAITMADLALAYSMNSESGKAERTVEEGLRIVQGSDKPSYRLAKAKLLSTWADAKVRSGQLNSAEKLLNESLRIREQLLLPGHPDIARTYLALANLKETQGKQRDAQSYRLSADTMLSNLRC